MITINVDEVGKPNTDYVEVFSNGIPRNPVQIRDRVIELLENGSEINCVSSEIPLNLIGNLVYDGIIKTTDVEVILEGETLSFDKEGYIIGWPLGYFSDNRDGTYYEEVVKKLNICI